MDDTLRSSALVAQSRNPAQEVVLTASQGMYLAGIISTYGTSAMQIQLPSPIVTSVEEIP